MIDYYEQIEAYIEGSLSPEVHQQMEAAMSNDEALKQAVEDYPIAKMISESLIEDEVRGILIESEGSTSKVKVQRGKSGPWIISITLLAALAVSYYQWNRHTTQTKLYAEVMKDYNPPINKGTRGNTAKSSILDQAIKEFDLRNFDASYDLFKGMSPKSDSIYWYLGHISLINGKVYEAKNYSNKIGEKSLKEDLVQYIGQIIDL